MSAFTPEQQAELHNLLRESGRDAEVLVRQLQGAVTSLDAPEAWRLVGTAGQPAFQNGWSNTTGTSQPMRFYKDGQGRVWVEGRVKNGVNATAAFTLPTGYRPDFDIYSVTLGQGFAVGYAAALTTGALVVATNGAAGSLNDVIVALSFRAT